jgi:hypothetical protein
MSIEDRIPALSDSDLSNLLANARRLSEGDAGRRKDEAERLVPLIQAELAERKARAPVKVAPKKLVAPRKAKVAGAVAKPRAKRVAPH